MSDLGIIRFYMRRVSEEDPASEEVVARIADRVRTFDRPAPRSTLSSPIPKTRYTKSGEVNIAYQSPNVGEPPARPWRWRR